MVGSTDLIGRLVVDDVLLQAERQLLRNRNQPSGQSQEKPAEQASAPLSHNDKTVASVLRTLVDERLNAALKPGNFSASLVSAAASTADTAAAASRVAAQYAEVDTGLRPDLPPAQPVPLVDIRNQQVVLAATSPELRMAMQSAFVSAAVRAQDDIKTGGGSQRSMWTTA